MARATFTPRLLSAIADCNCMRGTSSGVIAAQAGIVIAVPMPMAKVRATSIQAEIASKKLMMASNAAIMAIQTCTTIKYRRRSTMSESAPAGRAKRKTGNEVAVCTNATITAEGDSEVISQPAPTSCIQVPVLDASVAIQSQRKTERRNGDQVLTGSWPDTMGVIVVMY